MTLSADKLNQHSPYHLTQINDMAFRFVTDQQVHYDVGFYKDTFFMGVYICDPTDKRQAARDRLYHLWFYDYARNHEMTLFSDSVTFKNTKYYTGILMRHDHPMHDIILISYQNFLKHVPERIMISEK